MGGKGEGDSSLRRGFHASVSAAYPSPRRARRGLSQGESGELAAPPRQVLFAERVEAFDQPGIGAAELIVGDAVRRHEIEG